MLDGTREVLQEGKKINSIISSCITRNLEKRSTISCLKEFILVMSEESNTDLNYLKME